MTGRGIFITFEGGEGTGKTTQFTRLAEYLREVGVDLVVTREPGGTRVGEAVRAILLDPEHHGMSSRAELLLYVIHGILHLSGHDDHDPDDARRMHAVSLDLLRAIGYDNTVASPGDGPGG